MKAKKSRGKSRETPKVSPFAGGGGSRSEAGLALARFLGRILFRGPGLIVVSLLVGVLLIQWLAGRAAELPRFTVHTAQSRCLSRPAWLAGSDRLFTSILGEIQDNLARLPARSIFSEDIEEGLRARPGFLSPWIESIDEFERIFPSQYRVTFKLRRPVAYFLEANHPFFIDASGMVIGEVPAFQRDTVKVGVPRIIGFDGSIRRSGGRGGAGGKTRNRKLLEGAYVAREIEILDELELPGAARVSEIDVSGYGSGQADGVVLVTDNRCRILWGRSGKDPRFQGIDLTPRKKVDNFRKVLAEIPTLEGITQVNLFNDRPVVTRRRTEESSG